MRSSLAAYLPQSAHRRQLAERLVRGWRRVDRNEIRRLLEVSPLCQPVSDDTDVDQLFATYDAVLRDIADKLAPAHSTRRRPADRRRGSTLSVGRTERRQCRRLERRYRCTRSAADRRDWVDATRRRLRLTVQVEERTVLA